MILETEVSETQQISAVTVRVLEPKKDVVVEIFYQDGKDMTPFFVMKDGVPEPNLIAVKQATKAILTAVGIVATEK